jgi:hypothetical protein
LEVLGSYRDIWRKNKNKNKNKNKKTKNEKSTTAERVCSSRQRVQHSDEDK